MAYFPVFWVGYYANVGDSVPDQAASISSDLSTVYVLESPKFTLKQPARLSFDLFQKAVGPKLEVPTYLCYLHI